MGHLLVNQTGNSFFPGDCREILDTVPAAVCRHYNHRANGCNPQPRCGSLRDRLYSPDRNFTPSAGFEMVDEPNRERGGPPTMPAGKRPVLPVTVFTDYI
jgi:hypothetical protein